MWWRAAYISHPGLWGDGPCPSPVPSLPHSCDIHGKGNKDKILNDFSSLEIVFVELKNSKSYTNAFKDYIRYVLDCENVLVSFDRHLNE